MVSVGMELCGPHPKLSLRKGQWESRKKITLRKNFLEDRKSKLRLGPNTKKSF